MPFVDVAGAQIYWKRDGRDDAPSLILANSIGTDMDLWDAMLPHLRDRFALLRFDTRGHGASKCEPANFSMPLLARDVLAVADAAGIERFAIAGVSLGGMIGMELALLAPERVQQMALICTSATMDPAAWNDRIAKVRGQGMTAVADVVMGRFLSEDWARNNPGAYESIRRQLVAMDPQGYAGCGAAIRDMDLVNRLEKIGCPVLVVTGSRDTSTPLEGHGEHLVTRIPSATYVMLDAAHLAPLEAPDALADALLTFLES